MNAQRCFTACNEHLREIVRILESEWLIGIGDFAAKRAREVLRDLPLSLGQTLHPSPACPASNTDWAGTATAQAPVRRVEIALIQFFRQP